MSDRTISSSFALLVFPLALLVVYWEYTYFDGHPIEQTIPSFNVFLALIVLVVLEVLFRYDKSVSQEPLLVRDLASTAVNVLYTGTVASKVFIPVIVFFPELFYGCSSYSPWSSTTSCVT